MEENKYKNRKSLYPSMEELFESGFNYEEATDLLHKKIMGQKLTEKESQMVKILERLQIDSDLPIKHYSGSGGSAVDPF